MPRLASAKPDAAYVIGFVLVINACIFVISTVSDALVSEIIQSLDPQVESHCRDRSFFPSGLPDWALQARTWVDNGVFIPEWELPNTIVNSQSCRDVTITLADAIFAYDHGQDARRIATMPLRTLFFPGPLQSLAASGWHKGDDNWAKWILGLVRAFRDGYGTVALTLVEQALAPLNYIFVMGILLANTTLLVLRLLYQFASIGLGTKPSRHGTPFGNSLDKVVFAGSVVFAIFALWKAHRLAQGIARWLRALRGKGARLVALVESTVFDDTVEATVAK